ncbi:lipopolysaccharide biosynthesis protein [Paracoccus sp. MC1862]|uniref:lipopolysaccharide biosynthesis protein n=1 Tax=Paracoccus sp. MC1862 TaxID=2760307 RepID=UPI0016021237|nr:lipopolysaccharide biosynthesis protein [Paracoccus sp. MC1862]MBB1499144.1 lipopolysaccharide biosynthesis protein [Paracoccus sp. MC1862]QQO46798.1 lipopolysaccharide biosynthesis protein [Paracoccus sp. MC1862]
MAADSTVFDPPSGSLGRSVGRGALVTGGSQAVRLACQFASVIVLSRLLTPEHFGIVAMAAPVMAFIGLFQDLGLTQATVQKKNITHGEVNTLFWLNLAISMLLAALMVLAWPLVTRFYGDPRAGVLVAAMSLQLVLVGGTGQHLALLNRRMEFGRIAILDGLSAVLGLAVSVIWALVDPTFWALYAGGMATALVGLAGGWMLSRWRPGLPRWMPGAGSLVHFGAGITGFNFANFFSRNLDNILIGRYRGNEELGLYDRAYRLLLFPLQQVTNPLSRVMVPALSRMTDQPDRYRSAFLRVIPILLLVTLPGVALAVALADILVPFALGQQWVGSAVIFQALGFAGLLQPLNNPSGWLFISQGRSTEFMRWGIFVALTSIVAFVIGLPYGAFGVALAYAVSEYVRTPFLWFYIGKRGPVGAKDVTRVAFPFVVGAHLAVGVLWALRPHLPQDPLPALVLGTVLSYLMVIAFAALFAPGRATLRECLQLLRRRQAVVG